MKIKKVSGVVLSVVLMSTVFTTNIFAQDIKTITDESTSAYLQLVGGIPVKLAAAEAPAYYNYDQTYITSSSSIPDTKFVTVSSGGYNYNGFVNLMSKERINSTDFRVRYAGSIVNTDNAMFLR